MNGGKGIVRRISDSTSDVLLARATMTICIGQHALIHYVMNLSASQILQVNMYLNCHLQHGLVNV